MIVIETKRCQQEGFFLFIRKRSTFPEFWQNRSATLTSWDFSNSSIILKALGNLSWGMNLDEEPAHSGDSVTAWMSGLREAISHTGSHRRLKQGLSPPSRRGISVWGDGKSCSTFTRDLPTAASVPKSNCSSSLVPNPRSADCSGLYEMGWLVQETQVQSTWWCPPLTHPQFPWNWNKHFYQPENNTDSLLP